MSEQTYMKLGDAVKRPVFDAKNVNRENPRFKNLVDSYQKWNSDNDIDEPRSTYENDIIEYNGTRWEVIFDASQSSDQLVYQTNIYTGVQYKWDGLSWVKSFEGEYRAGTWRLEL